MQRTHIPLTILVYTIEVSGINFESLPILKVISQFSISLLCADTYSVKPQLPADFYHRLIAHGLSTVFLWTFTHLYGKFTESVPDARIRSDSKLVLLSLLRR